MRFTEEKQRNGDKRLICGVFPSLFFLVGLLAALFALILDDLFLGVVVFWPIGFFIALLYTMNQLKTMPQAERRQYLAALKKNKKK